VSDSLLLLSALVRFRFTKDLLVDDPASLSPRAYTAPFTYDLKLPVARLAVAGDHGDVLEVHGIERDEQHEIESELLRLVPIPTDPVDLPPPLPTPPTSDAVVAAAAKALEPAAPPPPAPPTSDAVVAASLLKE